MKHAGPKALNSLEPLLRAIRALNGLTEKKCGIFYHKSKAFLHFHEDPAGLYADLMRVGRYNVSTVNGRNKLFQTIKKKLRNKSIGANNKN